MTKSAKAKKAKKADFAKVKLKVGKKLKKAQNETRTDFKARKIIIKEQLGKKEDETLVTKKKHNIKELLSRLNHTNTYVRHDGLSGLLELVKKYEAEELIPWLSKLIPGMAPCVFDTDVLIRSTAVKFLEALIVKVGNHIEPYFSVVATHLSCAMVHLNSGVQADSLRLVNVLVKHTPSLLAQHANTLLNNFVNLISRKANTSQANPDSKVKKIDFTRLLHVNPNSTLTAHKWHVQLLQELSGFLEAILREQGHVEEQLPLTTWQTVVAGSVPPLILGSTAWGSSENTWLFSNQKQLEKFVLAIVPLLFQIWAEVDPKNNQEVEGDNLLNEEGVETLTFILSIVSHLMKFTEVCTQQQPQECGWFVGQLKSKYMSRIMSGFPYYRHIVASQNKNRKNNKLGNKAGQINGNYSIRHCDHLNVTLATLAVQLSLSSHFREKAVSFITKLLCEKSRDGEYSISAVVEILVKLLPQASKQEAEALVGGAQTCYQRLHPLKKDRPQLLQVLLAATHISHPQLWQCSSVGVWVGQVVEELSRREVQKEVLEAAVTLRLRANTDLRQLVEVQRNQITENLQQRGVPGLTETCLANRLKFLLKD